MYLFDCMMPDAIATASHGILAIYARFFSGDNDLSLQISGHQGAKTREYRV
jgi:hypothetical protein